MHANVGDHVIVDARSVGTPARRGTVLEVRGEAHEVHYRVRWEDGHESLFFPSSDAHVVETQSGS